MSLETLRKGFHAQALEYRNIDLLLQSDNFAIAYSASTKEDQDFIEYLLFGDNIDNTPYKDVIRKFIERQLKNLTPFYRMNIQKLREIGRNLSIDNYFILNKATLIEEIENVAERIKKNGC